MLVGFRGSALSRIQWRETLRGPAIGVYRSPFARRALNAMQMAASMDSVSVLKSLSSALGREERYIDTHCHLASTYLSYRLNKKDDDPEVGSICEFVSVVFPPEVCSIIDIFCEPPFSGLPTELANAQWKDGFEYYFAVGCHPHEASKFTDEAEKELSEYLKHDRAVALGECGLDYHYDNSPREVQKSILIKQLQLAVRENMPIIIHTREADDDILRILTQHLPREHFIHVHCFTDTPQLAQALLDAFPNLYIGITGVATYSSNLNTKVVVEQTSIDRLLLETDSPYMTPSPIHEALRLAMRKKGSGQNSEKKSEKPKARGKLRTCHSGMIPWTAQWVAKIKGISVEETLRKTKQNAERMYNISLGHIPSKQT